MSNTQTTLQLVACEASTGGGVVTAHEQMAGWFPCALQS